MNPAVAALLLFSDLHVAVRAGDVDKVRSLVAKGMNVNERDSLGGTALHDAAWAGDLRMAQLLLDWKADPNARHQEGGSTPLHYAVITNHPEFAALLLSRGADPKAASGSGATSLHLAANRGFTTIIELLLSKGLDVNLPDSNGLTALDEAAWKGELEVARLLLAKSARPQSALSAAAARGHSEMVELLLKAGARVDVRDRGGLTALDLAFDSRNTKVVAVMLDHGAKPGSAPLQDAVLRGHLEMVALLLARGGADPNSLFFLHDAALKGHLEIVDLLIAKGADLKRRNAQGATPLHDAALAGRIEVVKLLLARRAPFDEVDSQTGATALHSAASWGRIECVQALLDGGADPNIPNKAALSPLKAAEANGHSAVITLLRGKGAH